MSISRQTNLINDFNRNFRRLAGCPEKQESGTEVWGEREEQLKLLHEARILGWTVKILAAFLIGMAILVLAIRAEAHAEVVIDLDAIAQIESSGCREKQGRYEHAVGCFQITAPVVAEWNQFNPSQKIQHADLMDNDLNRRVADWYLNKRIPQMIRHFKKPDTVENRLIAYNAGIAYVKNGKTIPNLTKRYLQKYARLTK